MSKAVSALNGASFEGFVKVEETGLRGMITVRGDLDSAEMSAAVRAATGAQMPAQRKVASGDKGVVAWMSPDELLVVVDYAEVLETVATLTTALASSHALVANVSDARAVYHVSGEGSRDVLAKLAPVDFGKDAFGVGDIRRSRFAQVPAAVWGNEDGSFEVICFRSVAQYVFDLLKVSATPGGEVGFH
ncbi:sarcosine oxidase subunit gamma [Shimia sp. R11_0]|uniref:sarcosine oxidase subunit gamma n=1 Tax=Shimia sp. R11_0 TaxID=2821096 RepID=UPI001ADBC7A3|nr:sarcosine oxidase subunit gamma family protein [Shimia sp. R11_0]MBO9477195.1 sarcosine oxidase subunit gamma [Shimia sp. R11_0]